MTIIRLRVVEFRRHAMSLSDQALTI